MSLFNPEDASQSYTKKVNALTASISTQIPSNGEVWYIESFEFYSNPNQDTHVRLVWDYGTAGEQLLAIGYGAGVTHSFSATITGDGTKKLAIILQNDSLGAEYLAGAYKAIK